MHLQRIWAPLLALLVPSLGFTAPDKGQKDPGPKATLAPADKTVIQAEEDRMLDVASRQLADKELDAALLTLDIYLTQYGHDGGRRFEALLMEVQILRKQEREGDALDELDDFQIPLREAELLVNRGELRMGAGRNKEAFIDFNGALKNKKLKRTIHERALFGRGMSRLKVGDSNRARSDLRQYCELYPTGRFIKTAAQIAGVSSGGPMGSKRTR